VAHQLGFAPAIDPDEVERVAALEGTAIRVEPYNHEATRDTIRHYAWGIGDDNPLWCDPAVAAKGPYGDLLAPPTFLYSVFDGAIGAGLAGVQPVYAGTSWRFFQRVHRGDELEVESRFGKVRELSGRTASQMLLQQAISTYSSRGHVVAEAVAETFRLPRRGADGQGLAYEARDEHVYSEAEIQGIARQALSEYRRGAEPIDLASLTVGQAVPEVVKGPIDRITMTAYYAGCIGSPGYKACELAWAYRDYALRDPSRLPTNYDPSYFAETVLPSLGHQDADVAREIGMPNAYDNGPQRCGWFGHAVTNWMGDYAFLSKLSIRLRRPDIFGDTVWVGGSVTDFRADGERGVVGLELRARNQLGEEVATGSAEVHCWADGRPTPVIPPAKD